MPYLSVCLLCGQSLSGDTCSWQPTFFSRFPRNRPEPELSLFESIFVGKCLRPHDVNQTHGMYFACGQQLKTDDSIFLLYLLFGYWHGLAPVGQKHGNRQFAVSGIFKRPEPRASPFSSPHSSSVSSNQSSKALKNRKLPLLPMSPERQPPRLCSPRKQELPSPAPTRIVA